MGEWKMEWKCGRCNKKYTSDEYHSLSHIQLIETDTDPSNQHGYTRKCLCGYIFGRDRMHLVDCFDIEKEGIKSKLEISTIFLELNYSDYWYETMIFSKSGNVRSEYQNRYKTQEEAIEGHKNAVEKIKNGKFIIKPYEYQLILEEDENGR